MWTGISLPQYEISDVLTTTVAVFLIAAINAVNIRITAPADGNAVAIFALELINVALHITAILKHKQGVAGFSAPLM